MTLTQKGKHTAKATENKEDDDNEFQRFKMIKHPDQKKYMHYALANAEGQWLSWNTQSGKLTAGPTVSWFAMLPVNENKPEEQGWLIKQDKFYLSMASKSSVKAKEY